ncbi:hypothetical protein QBC46DRAFT_439773 [Diplogelasinospora grovesii]|uniref:Heterokaryon incompatibility domain-containing protein n=1 Tax=Diplogelasinospora grovesii TaxID=303347 RepID=A0AAN6S2H3_9PEZI|nr:hypothetical protein QBC46DRAFT_439773 [Diplogelasinospora grovesii]
MLCKVCVEGLQGIWDPSKTKRVCRVDEFDKDTIPLEDSKFVTVETYKTVKPYDPELRRPEHWMFGHHLTQESFEQSVRDGCVMCDAFKPWHAGHEVKSDPKITALGYYSLFSIGFEDCPMMYMYVNDSRGGFALTPHIVQDENMNLNISPCTGDDTTWGIIQGWLAACLQTHGDRCNERPSATFVPPRLLQLEPAAAETFRVVHATEVEPGTRYVTLSHCCDDGLQLDKSTLEQLSIMSTPQPLSILPLTLREACTVVVARLGLRHLWVDRLCIVPRDDLGPSGFARAARRDVFRNAFLNIAASGSSSGLFVKRDSPALVAPTVFDFPVGAGATAVPHRSSLETPRGWTRAFRDDPLSRSAAALQERLLAPRVVHFGGKMVFWECHGATCAEIHPHGVVLNQTLTSSGRPEERPWKTLLSTSSARRVRDDDPVEQVFADWFAILETHSACEVVATPPPGERLLAMSGLAADMKTLLRDRGCKETGYVAGMWKAMLPGGLVWNLRGPGARPAKYRAPSWSWAAVDGSVNFHDRTPGQAAGGIQLCELVGATTTCVGGDEMGEVTAGSIVIKGKLALGKLHPPMPSLRLPRNETVLIKSLADPDQDGGGVCWAEPVPNSPSGYNCQWTVLFDTEEDVEDEILCLPIRARTMSNIGCHVDGLALSWLEDGCYVRRGKWSILADTEDEALGIFKSLPQKELEIV